MSATPSTPRGDFPPSPWSMRGHLYLSLWRLGRTVVGTAFVDYQPASELTYAELLRARPTRHGRRPAVTITDIWVDSPASRAGGRTLWALPKDLAGFSMRYAEQFRGEAHTDGRPVAVAEFDPGRRLPGRLPFRSRTRQRRDSGEVVVTPLTGSAWVRRARAWWKFPEDGPFADLRGRRPLTSVVLEDFDLRFGA